MASVGEDGGTHDQECQAEKDRAQSARFLASQVYDGHEGADYDNAVVKNRFKIGIQSFFASSQTRQLAQRPLNP